MNRHQPSHYLDTVCNVRQFKDYAMPVDAGDIRHSILYYLSWRADPRAKNYKFETDSKRSLHDSTSANFALLHYLQWQKDDGYNIDEIVTDVIHAPKKCRHHYRDLLFFFMHYQPIVNYTIISGFINDVDLNTDTYEQLDPLGRRHQSLTCKEIDNPLPYPYHLILERLAKLPTDGSIIMVHLSNIRQVNDRYSITNELDLTPIPSHITQEIIGLNFDKDIVDPHLLIIYNTRDQTLDWFPKILVYS